MPSTVWESSRVLLRACPEDFFQWNRFRRKLFIVPFKKPVFGGLEYHIFRHFRAANVTYKLLFKQPGQRQLISPLWNGKSSIFLACPDIPFNDELGELSNHPYLSKIHPHLADIWVIWPKMEYHLMIWVEVWKQEVILCFESYLSQILMDFASIWVIL